MKLSQVAVQLYTIRDHLKTTADFAASMARLKAIGYQAVQVNGAGPVPEDELLAICKGEGLTICATHESSKTILENPQAVVDRLGRLGTTFTAYPSPHVPLTTPAEVQTLAKGLDKAGETLRRAGVVLCYHNHANEFRRIGGKTILATIYDESDAQNLQGEIDTYWVQAGGGDPVAWCARLAKRLPLLHLKDYAVGHDTKPIMAEIGNGNLDWPAIIAAAEKSGCKWFIVEQDTCPGDPFASLKASFDFIAANLVGGKAP